MRLSHWRLSIKGTTQPGQYPAQCSADGKMRQFTTGQLRLEPFLLPGPLGHMLKGIVRNRGGAEPAGQQR